MEYLRLGDSGLKVSKVILGCMSFGDPNWQSWLLDADKALPIMKYAYDHGINTFDVADTYSNGRSEEIVGQFLKHYQIPRESVVIMSKIFHHVDPARGKLDAVHMGSNDGPRVDRVGLNRKHVMAAVDASVARLGTYIDVLQTHRLDREAPIAEIMKALHDVVESGKARYIGGSSMAAWEFQMCQNIAAQHGWTKFISMQGLYNLLYREEEREMIPYCRATGVGYMPWSPLAAGILTHPWSQRDDARESADVFLQALFRGREEESDKQVVARVQELAEAKGVSMAQIALAYTMSKASFAPISGLETTERIDQAVRACGIEIREEEGRYLEEPYLPKPVAGY